MGHQAGEASSVQSGRDTFDFRQAVITVLGNAQFGGGITEDQLRAILTEFFAKSAVAPAVPLGNNFTDAGIVWNRLFTGREDELARLHTALAHKSQAITHAVTGAGGVGKTELARAFALLFAWEYQGVWWIDASDGGFSGSLSRTFKFVTGQTAPQDARPEDLAQELCRRWSQGRHLVILDNLESAARLSLFALGGECRVLATTRKDLSAAATVESFRVDVISEDAAVVLLTKQTAQRKPPIAEHDLRAIAAELGCHTLAVALAGAYLGRYGDVSALEYVARLQAQGIGEFDPREDGEDNDPLLLRYRHSVRSCLMLHMDRFKGGREVVLLGLASLCHSTGIPLDLLAAAAKVDLMAARKLAANLAEVSIVTYEATLGVHRLMQSVVRSLLDQEICELMIDGLVAALNPDFADPDDHTRWPRLSVLAPHASAVFGHAAAMHATGDSGRLANGLGGYLWKAGRFADAQRAYEVCLQITAATFGPEHPNMAAILSNLALIQKDQGDLPGARASMERAIAIDSKHFAPDHPTFATSYSNLATIQQDQGDMPGARGVLERAIAIKSKHFAPDHPTVAISYNNLAHICKDEGDRAAACVNFKKALAILLKHFDESHPNVKSVRKSMKNAGCDA